MSEPEILHGVGAIAAFLGVPEEVVRKRGDLPTFPLGQATCARPETLRAWVRLVELHKRNKHALPPRPDGADRRPHAPQDGQS